LESFGGDRQKKEANGGAGSPWSAESLTFFDNFFIETSSVRSSSEFGKPVHEVSKKRGKEGQAAFPNSGSPA